MSAERDAEIARLVQHALESTPGVARLFRAGPLLARVVDAGVDLLGRRDAERPFVDVKDDGSRAIASIGVDFAVPAAATCRSAANSAASALAAAGTDAVSIELTVVHISEP